MIFCTLYKRKVVLPLMITKRSREKVQEHVWPHLIHLKILKKSFEIHPRLSHMTAKSAFFQTTKKIWKIYQQKYQRWVDFLILFFEKKERITVTIFCFAQNCKKGQNLRKGFKDLFLSASMALALKHVWICRWKYLKYQIRAARKVRSQGRQMFFLGVFEERRKNRYSIDWLTAFSKVQKNLPHSKNLYSHFFFLCGKLLKSSFPN